MKTIVPRTLKGVLILDAVTAIQAGRLIYLAALPMRVLPSLFAPGNVVAEPDRRAQRTPSPARIARLTRLGLDLPASTRGAEMTLPMAGGDRPTAAP
ncbi:MAG: hypothetical protein GKS00_02080 [Alphaproteobacteria bacterium]|nr:hypothetical protein [Alphaproteobacteria bacterium]